MTPIYSEEVETVERTKTLEWSFSDSGDYHSLSGYLRLNYEFVVHYLSSVNVGENLIINITAKDVNVDFYLHLDFSGFGVNGYVDINTDATLFLGLLKECPLTTDINVYVEVWSFEGELSATLYASIIATTFISGRVIANGTAIPPEQYVSENVSWVSENNTYTLTFVPDNPGTINVDIVDLLIFFLPSYLKLYKLVIHDIPLIGDVEIPLNFEYTLILTSFEGSNSRGVDVMQEKDSVSLGDISIDISVIEPGGSRIQSLIGIIVIGVIIVVSAVVIIRRAKK